MSLVGCKLSHAKWGIGIVEQQTDKTLSVRFSYSDNTEHIKHFVYPDAILQKHLSAPDAKTLLIINKSLEARKCSVCGATNVSTEIIDEKRFCRSCKKSHTVSCYSCGRMHLTKFAVLANDEIKWFDGRYTLYTSISLCQSCADLNSFVCDTCQRRYTNQHLAPAKIREADLCKVCFDEVSEYCYFCKSPFDRYKGVRINYNGSDIYMCPLCAESHTFECDECNMRYLLKDRRVNNFSQKTLCPSCFDYWLKACSFCGSAFERNDGYCTYDSKSRTNIYVCPHCLDEQTFECARCEERDLISYLAKSRYIPTNRNLCIFCVDQCYGCHQAILNNKTYEAFGHCYCPDCWENVLKSCAYCDRKFLPAHSEEQFCPDCIRMKIYISRVKEADYLLSSYRTMVYGDLEKIDRCAVFTQLYKHTVQYVSDHNELRSYTNCCVFDDKAYKATDIYYYIVLRIGGHRAVITWLPHKMVFIQDDTRATTMIPYSVNVTMTELRRKGYYNVCSAIDHELELSAEHMDTSAGCMKILNRPVLLRVQTGFDKNYGKQWNGPGEYIEIGNYGDTTNFWVIGVLEESE